MKKEEGKVFDLNTEETTPINFKDNKEKKND